MKRKNIQKRHIVLILLLVLLMGLAAVAVWQRENIKAVLDYANYSQEELEERLQQNDQTIKDAVEAIPEVTIRDVTEEEKQALREGTLSQEELVNRLLGGQDQQEENSAPSADPQPSASPESSVSPEPSKEPEAEPSASASPAESPSPEPSQSPSSEEDYQKALSELIARVYVLREEYLILLDNLQEEATADYKGTPKAQRTTSWLASFVSGYLAKGTALEKQCDKKMDAIVIEMETLIKKYNGDLSLVDTMISTYANEKSLKKAWYMSELEKKGLI